jgi:hypothetical protein
MEDGRRSKKRKKEKRKQVAGNYPRIKREKAQENEFKISVMKKLLWGIGISIVLIACLFIPVTPSSEKYGYFYGECWRGDCEVNLTVSENELALEKLRSYPDSSITIGPSLSPGTSIIKTSNANSFKIAVPLFMLFKGRRIGCPDCTDGGGIILEYSMFGIKKKFVIDRANLPFYISNLSNEVDGKIAAAKRLSK